MSLKRNLASNFLLTISNIVLPLIVFPYVARTLSSSNFGLINFVDACTQYLIVFSTLGIPFYGVREVAKNRNYPIDLSALVRQLVFLNTALAIFFSGVFLLIYPFILKIQGHFSLVLIGCGILVSTPFSIEWYYQGIEKFRFITIRSVLIKIAFVLAVFLLIRRSEDYSKYYFLSFLVIVATAIINYAFFLKRSPAVSVKYLDAFRHLKPLIVLFSINIAISVYTILDTIILGLLTNTISVSLYVVPLRIVKTCWVVIAGFGIVFVPKIATFWRAGSIDEIESLLSKSASMVYVLGIPFFFFCFLFPVELLSMVAGGKYVESANSLRILSVVPFIIGMCNVYGSQFLLLIGEEKRILHATIAGLFTSLILNVLLDPLWKQAGASVACLCAEAVVCGWLYFFFRKRIRIKIDWNLLLLLCSTVFLCFVGYFIFKLLLSGIYLLLSTCISYMFFLFILQVVFFRNAFIQMIFISFQKRFACIG